MKKQLIIITLLLSVFFATPLSANPYSSYMARAKVLHVEPIYETVALPPHRDCRDKQSRYEKYRSHPYGRAAPTGLIEGFFVNSLDHRDNRSTAAMAGARLELAIGDDPRHRSDRNHYKYGKGKQRCHNVRYFKRRDAIAGYRVKYRYNGNIFWTRTEEHPGRHIKVRVEVHPSHNH